MLITRIAGGDAALWEIALSIGIMLVSIVAVYSLAARLYEGAILRTGAGVKLRDAWRSAAASPPPARRRSASRRISRSREPAAPPDRRTGHVHQLPEEARACDDCC